MKRTWRSGLRSGASSRVRPQDDAAPAPYAPSVPLSVDDVWCDRIRDEAERLRRNGIRGFLRLDELLSVVPADQQSAAVIDSAICEIFEDAADVDEAGDHIIQLFPQFAPNVRLAISFRHLDFDASAPDADLVPTDFPVALPREFGPLWRGGEQRYLLTQRLSGGSCGASFRALDRARSDAHRCAEVVVKIEDRISKNVDVLAEAARVTRINHPGISRIVDAGECANRHYVVAEYVEGLSLFAWAQRRTLPIPAREAARCIHQLARALGAAHTSGVLHLDLHPGNVIMTGADAPVIIDFGLGRSPFAHVAPPSEDPLAETAQGTYRGALAFVAPERLQGSASPSPACDVYSATALLFWLLTGETPTAPSTAPLLSDISSDELSGKFRALPESLLGSYLDRDLCAIVLRGLAANPADRHASADELAFELERYLNYEPLQRTGPTPFRRTALAWRRASPVFRFGVPIAAIAFFLTGGLLIQSRLSELQAGRDLAASQVEAFRSQLAAAETKQIASDIAQHQLTQTREWAKLVGGMLTRRRAGPMKSTELLPVLAALHELSGSAGLTQAALCDLAERRIEILDNIDLEKLPGGVTGLTAALLEAATASWLLEAPTPPEPQGKAPEASTREGKPLPPPPPPDEDGLPSDQRAVNLLIDAEQSLAALLPKNDPMLSSVRFRLLVARVLATGGESALAAQLRPQTAALADLPESVLTRLKPLLEFDPLDEGSLPALPPMP
ncbi:hypothetical protein BH11PLA1_BH11PLA1_18700 [soil metagenome]